MTVQDWLVKRSGVPLRKARGLPIVLPRVGRRDLPTLTKDLGMTRGAEIGVWKGAYTALFCQANPELHMLCVDPWQSYPAWLDTKNAMPVEQATKFMEESYQIALERLGPLNTTIVRQFSVEAASDVPDGSLDFIHIDGNHVLEAVLEDLTVWAPKVRAGGFVSGHDYRHFKNKPTIHVIEAVQIFTKQHQIDPWFVLGGDKTPSFIWQVAG